MSRQRAEAVRAGLVARDAGEGEDAVARLRGQDGDDAASARAPRRPASPTRPLAGGRGPAGPEREAVAKHASPVVRLTTPPRESETGTASTSTSAAPQRRRPTSARRLSIQLSQPSPRRASSARPDGEAHREERRELDVAGEVVLADEGAEGGDGGHGPGAEELVAEGEAGDEAVDRDEDGARHDRDRGAELRAALREARGRPPAPGR